MQLRRRCQPALDLAFGHFPQLPALCYAECFSSQRATIKKHVAPTASPHQAGPTEFDSLTFDRRDFGDSKRFVFIQKPTFVSEAPRPAYSVAP